MSRPTNLPPRCPSQNRLLGLAPHKTQKESYQIEKHRRFTSLDSVAEEQPSCLDDLFRGSEKSTPAVFDRRSASDSAARNLPLSNVFDEHANMDQRQSLDSIRGMVDACGFEGDFVYGPNSPRHSGEFMRSENLMVSALMKNIQEKPLEFLSADIFFDALKDDQKIVEENVVRVSDDSCSEKGPRRHSGQRSRVRKLQYIAELERIVGVYQAMEEDLISKVNSLHQQRIALSVENKKLKWKIINLRKEKIMKDGEQQSLKKELEGLKLMYGRHRRSKSASYFELGRIDSDPSLTMDMAKLRLCGGPGDGFPPLGHGLHG